jgi:hypothetical protein
MAIQAFDSDALRETLEKQLEQIDIEEERLRKLIADKIRIQQLIKTLQAPADAHGEPGTPPKQREYQWTKEVKKYFEEAMEGLYFPAQIVERICATLGIEKSDNGTRNIRAVLDKLRSQNIIGSVKDPESGKALFGAWAYFSDNSTLKPEYKHLLD